MEISILSPLQLILLLLRVTTLHAQVNCREHVLSTFMEESLRPDPTKLAFNVLKELNFYNLSHL